MFALVQERYLVLSHYSCSSASASVCSLEHLYNSARKILPLSISLYWSKCISLFTAVSLRLCVCSTYFRDDIALMRAAFVDGDVECIENRLTDGPFRMCSGTVSLRMEELVDPSRQSSGLLGDDFDEEDEEENEKVQVLATFYFEGKKYVVAAPLEPVLIIGSPAVAQQVLLKPECLTFK